MKNGQFTLDIIANTIIEPGMSGGNRIFIEFAKRWAEKGVDINVFTSNVGEKLCHDNGLNNCNYVTWVSSKFNSLGNFALYIIGTIKGITSAFKVSLKDNHIVYSSSDFWPDSLPGLILKIRNKKNIWIACLYLFAPNPFSKSSPYEKREFIKGFIYWISQAPIYWVIKRYADVVFVTNEPDRERFVSKKLPLDKVVAIRGGVDISTPRLIPESNTKKYDAVFIGRFHAQKGVLELIDIWRLVCNQKKDAKLALIGIGSLEKQMRDKIKVFDLGNDIDFLGFKDGVEKYKIFKESKMALYPATLDHWSMAPVEAMSCGLPLVTFDIQTLKFLHPKGMIKIPCYNLEAFASAVVELLNDDKLYKKNKADALLWANEWDWNKRADEVFEGIINYY